MRNPANVFLPRHPELHRPDGYASDESMAEPIAVLEEHRQTTELIKGKARLGRFSCVHYSLEIPEEPNDDTLEIHVNGLAAAKPTYKGVRRASTRMGQISTTIGLARGTAAGDLLQPANLFRTEELEAESVQAVIEDIEKQHGLTRVKLRGHSKGGRTAIAVAENAPEKIEHVTLVSAAGLELNSVFTMAARLPGFVYYNVLPYRDVLYQEFHDPQVATDIMRYILQNPFRTAAEALSVSRTDIRERVRSLGSNGIRVSIIDALSDYLISNKTVESTLGPEVAYYSVHPNPAIGHLGPQTHPREMVEEYQRADQAVQAALAPASQSTA